MTDIKTLGPAELGKLLHKKEATIRVDSHRRPESLPPRLDIPSSRKLLWLETDVIDWLKKRKRIK